RIFLEILSNASDHTAKSRRSGCKVDEIVVTMNKTNISVKNYGLPIPIEKVPNTDIWLVQKIFGQLRTSSHYTETERHEVGTNGVGSKATNIFSKKFTVVVENATLGKKYTQVWEDNMKICNPPTIVNYKGAQSSVMIDYLMDFKKFGYNDM